MNGELFKSLYMWAVVVLAAVAVMHLVNRNKKGGCKRNAGPTPAQQIDPKWWTPGPTIGPYVSRYHTRMTLAGL